MTAAPRSLGLVHGGLEAFAVGGEVHLVAALDPAWPPEVAAAFDRWRQAGLRGACDCGATADLDAPSAPWPAHVRDTPVLEATMPHAPGCPAGEQAVAEVFARHGADLPS